MRARPPSPPSAILKLHSRFSWILTLKVGFVSLGCPKNLVDTEVMMGQLAARGHALTSRPGEADVIVVNTCSFIDAAKQESIDTILEMSAFKRSGRARKLVVAGCLVERFHDRIIEQLPEVDAILGVNQLDSIVDLCEDRPARADAARFGHAAPLRLHQDRRGLRPPLRVLRHPALPRQVPQPAPRVGGGRGHAAVCAGHP
jgi:hypothetical protein